MADFYGTAANFRTYHNARGNDVSEYDEDAEVEAALLVASEFIDARYISTLTDKYFKTGGRDQVRSLPLIGLVDKYGYEIGVGVVPREAENATYEAAFRELGESGSLFKDFTPPKYKSVSVDGAVSVQFVQFGSVHDTLTQFSVIDAIMEPLLSGSKAAMSSLTGSSARV